MILSNYSRLDQVFSQNLIRDLFLKSDNDYLLMLESDIISSPDTLRKILKAQKQIITATNSYKTLNQEGIMAIKELDVRGRHNRLYTLEDIKDKEDPFFVGGIGFGFTLLTREVIEKISFRLTPRSNVCSDVVFSQDAKCLGYKLYLHPKVHVKHLQQVGRGYE